MCSVGLWLTMRRTLSLDSASLISLPSFFSLQINLEDLRFRRPRTKVNWNMCLRWLRWTVYTCQHVFSQGTWGQTYHLPLCYSCAAWCQHDLQPNCAPRLDRQSLVLTVLEVLCGVWLVSTIRIDAVGSGDEKPSLHNIFSILSVQNRRTIRSLYTNHRPENYAMIVKRPTLLREMGLVEGCRRLTTKDQDLRVDMPAAMVSLVSVLEV